MSNYIVLLYSKYSAPCKLFFEKFKECPVQIKIQPICIDNEMVRRKIFESPSLRINKVPCVIINQESTPLVYEGVVAFKWLDNAIQQFIEMTTTPSRAPPPHTSPPPHLQPQSNDRLKGYTVIAEGTSGPIASKKVRRASVSPVSSVIDGTVEDVMDDPADLEPIQEETTEEEDEPDFPVMDDPSGMGVAGANPKVKKMDDGRRDQLASRIAQIAREREIEDEAIEQKKRPKPEQPKKRRGPRKIK